MAINQKERTRSRAQRQVARSVRRISSEDSVEVDQQRLNSLAQEFFNNNSLANEYAKKSEAARKDLLALMVDSGEKSLPVSFTNTKGDTVERNVVVSASERSGIDVFKLLKEVGEEVFMKCVSATISAVEDHAGSIVAEKCRISFKGNANVKLEKR